MTKKRSGGSNFRRSRATAAESQSKIPTWAWLTGAGILAVLVIAGLFILGNRGPGLTSGDIEGVLIYPEQSQTHRDGDITYSQDVPVGGPHNPQWQNCGIYDQPLRRENVIHSMEHGAVWVAYSTDLPTEQVEVLQNLVRQEQAGTQERWIVLSPQPNLDDPIVVTAWRVQLRLDNASDQRLPQFVASYVKGPYYPEPGANCTFGGIGTPLS